MRPFLSWVVWRTNLPPQAGSAARESIRMASRAPRDTCLSMLRQERRTWSQPSTAQMRRGAVGRLPWGDQWATVAHTSLSPYNWGIDTALAQTSLIVGAPAVSYTHLTLPTILRV